MTFRLAPSRILAAAVTPTATVAAPAVAGSDAANCRRIATVRAFQDSSIEKESVAEIVAATADGEVALDAGPTSVAIPTDGFVLASANTSESFTNPSGTLQIIDESTRTIVRTIDLGGRPDAIAISSDGTYAAICIENERDENLGDGDFAATGGLVPEKIEGRMVDSTGRTWIANDNDGVDDDDGETQLLEVGDLFD